MALPLAPLLRPKHPLLLIVIDGWGRGPAGSTNAIHLAVPKTLQRLEKEYPSTLLEASGEAVGLPAGQMGNSEVGHLNIGAGRIVNQDLVRITKTLQEGRLGTVPAIRDLFDYCKQEKRPLHLLGLLGPGGVHSHEDHLFGLLEAADRGGISRVWVHHVLDGRDTPPKSALDFARTAQSRIDRHPQARVATVSGRYWTMDRDKRWDRIEKSYRMFAQLEGHRSDSALSAIQTAYDRGETDEFVTPTLVGAPDPLRTGDAMIVYNFRPDRVRQIVRAFTDPNFKEFPNNSVRPRLVTMTLYDQKFSEFNVSIAFPPQHPQMTLGEYYSQLGLRQLRVAETEKYAHVTYFFSGGREAPFPEEDRLLVPSPKVSTYDLKPEMSAKETTRELVGRLKTQRYDLVVLNFANPDMVGHTGKIEPTVTACQVVDECIRELVEVAQANDYLVAITADHGNAEAMVDAKGQPQTAHTTNPVPFLLVHSELKNVRLRERGNLSSVAPTLLEALQLPIPKEMTAPSLLPLKKAFK